MSLFTQHPYSLTGKTVSSLVARWAQPNGVRSVQRGTIIIANGAASNTGTITAVNTGSSYVSLLGNQSDDGGNYGTATVVSGIFPAVALTNATTVTVTRSGTPASTLPVSFNVIEYYPGTVRSIQSGTITIALGTLTNTATITSVTTNKAFMPWQGFINSYASTFDTTNPTRVCPTLVLTNATTVTASVFAATLADLIVSYTVVEFW